MRKKRLELSELEIEELKKIEKEGVRHHDRRRAKALLLLANGKMIKELVEIFDVKRDTIGRWRKEWESQRKVLMRKGRGRKETLSDEIQEEIHSLVKEYPNNIKIVHQMVEEKHNIKFSIDTLRRVIKKNSNLNV